MRSANSTPLRSAKRIALEDAIVDGLENAVFIGTMTKPQMRRYYRKLGDLFGIEGLVARSKPEKKEPTHKMLELKRKVLASLSNTFNKTVAPLPVEAEAIKEVVKSVVPAIVQPAKAVVVTRLRTIKAKA